MSISTYFLITPSLFFLSPCWMSFCFSGPVFISEILDDALLSVL